MRSPRLIVTILLFVVCFTNVAAFAANNPVPYVNQPLVPTSAAAGGAAFTLTVNGTGFVPGATVQWDGSARTTTFVTSSQVTAAITAADIATAATATISVINPGPGGGSSNGIFFPVGKPTSSVAYTSTTVPAVPTGTPSFVRPVKLVYGDFNGDGKQDIATLNNNATVSVLLGKGDGSFQAAVVYDPFPSSGPSRSPEGLAVGDFNGDGKLDVAVSDQFNDLFGNSQDIFVLLGNGDGTFAPALPAYFATARGTVGTVLLAADVNGDGKLDLVEDCENPLQTGLCVLSGNGDGTFAPGGLPAVVAPSFTSGAVTAAIGDFNGDGKLDLAIAYSLSGSGTVAVALGNGDGTFGVLTTVDTTAGAGEIAAADFDGNGKLDLAYYSQDCSVPTSCKPAFQTYAGNGDGTFQPALPSIGAPAVDSRLLVGDFNNDGILDVAIANAVLLGRGDGTFAANPAPLPQNAMIALDLNGDGNLDLAAGGANGTVALMLRTPPDFTGFSSPTSQTVVAGSNTSYSVQVIPLYGSLSDVTLSVTGMPRGVTATYQPATVPNGNGVSLLSVNTTSASVPGTYTLTLTGTAGSTSHSAPITLIVNPASADFSGDITPGGQLIAVGQTAGYVISVSPVNGFTGDVTLSASGFPTGSVVSFNPPVIAGGSGTSVLSVTPPVNAPSGLSVLTIAGTSGSLSHSGKRELNVNNTADFGGFVSPPTNSVLAGQRASYTINVTSTNGYTGSTTLSLSGLPAGATYRLTPTTVMGGAGTSSLLIATSASTPVGSYTLTLTGQSGSDVKSTTIQMNVNASAGDFGGSIAPTSQSVAAGTGATYTVSIAPNGGFTGNVALSLSNFPSGATVNFTPGNVISGGSGSASFTIDTTAVAPGTYSIVVTGASGGITHSGSISLTVN